MSAPNTNLDKQSRRHRGPLRGMFAVVLFALVLLLLLGFWAFRSGPVEDGDEAQVITEDGGDPAAVTVPSLRVEAPQSGQADTVNPTVAPSEAAQPLDPVEGEGGESVIIEE